MIKHNQDNTLIDINHMKHHKGITWIHTLHCTLSQAVGEKIYLNKYFPIFFIFGQLDLHLKSFQHWFWSWKLSMLTNHCSQHQYLTFTSSKALVDDKIDWLSNFFLKRGIYLTWILKDFLQTYCSKLFLDGWIDSPFQVRIAPLTIDW